MYIIKYLSQMHLAYIRFQIFSYTKKERKIVNIGFPFVEFNRYWKFI